MPRSAFDNFFQKVKSATTQAADNTAKQAKIAKYRMNLMTLQTEKSRYLQTVGIRVYTMFLQNRRILGDQLFDQVKDDLGNIERIDVRMQELDENIAELKSKEAELEIKDVTTATAEQKEKPEEPPKQG